MHAAASLGHSNKIDNGILSQSNISVGQLMPIWIDEYLATSNMIELTNGHGMDETINNCPAQRPDNDAFRN